MDTTANTLAVYRKEVKYLIFLLDSVMRKGVSCAGHRMCRSNRQKREKSCAASHAQCKAKDGSTRSRGGIIHKSLL